jgi:peptide deformylase
MKSLQKQKVALEVLKSPCKDVEVEGEAKVVVSLLESILKDYGKRFISISAPETNILKRVAIIRTPELSLDLINPKIIEKSGRLISFKESCISFPENTLNCFRHETIVIENGFNKELIKFKDYAALMVQHEIDHLNGSIFHDRKICLAVVRPGGKIFPKDFCPCGSKKRFSACCQMT